MNLKYKTLFITLVLCLLVSDVFAQRVLLVEKPGKFKNYKYFVGDEIVLKIAPYGEKLEGILHEVTDTSLLINFDNEIMLDDIQVILRPRWGMNILSKVTRIAGAGYFVLDVVNRTINNQSPVVDKNTLMISAGLVAFSYALVPFHDKRLKRGEKWRIKVLNMSMYEEVPNPFLR
ncbi:MAG: hypothetical protein V2I47_03305 [Bacteroidales bacterium]|jgi:hypothetical protein|nr:hypothetical protein [Bacteroidales bacterium]